jgi:hypothetical protein
MEEESRFEKFSEPYYFILHHRYFVLPSFSCPADGNAGTGAIYATGTIDAAGAKHPADKES